MTTNTLRSIMVIATCMISCITAWGATPIFHIAEKNESIYSIAHRYGYSADELVRINPSMRNGIKPGTRILIPRGDLSVNKPTTETDIDTNSHSNSDISTANDASTNPMGMITDSDTINMLSSADSIRQLNIAVMLPFQTLRDKPTRQAQNYTDFIRGMLMAIDTLHNTTHRPRISLLVYDTYDDIDSIKNILADSRFQESDFIIAPDNAEQIEAIALYADDTNKSVLNLFAVKNEAHIQHSSVMQANIPHEQMYETAILRFIQKYDGYTPVILDEYQSPASDKLKFIEALISALNDKEITYRRISYTDTLSPDSLAWMNTDDKYVFVPSSGSRSSVSAILPALLNARSNFASGSGTVTLFGYPEWVILPQDIIRKLHELDATIYSRFASNPNGYRIRTFASNFRSIFNSAMLSTAPSFALLGYDTAMWLIDNAPEAQSYSGLQNTFKFSPAPDGKGKINDALYLITFQSTGLIDNNADL